MTGTGGCSRGGGLSPVGMALGPLRLEPPCDAVCAEMGPSKA